MSAQRPNGPTAVTHQGAQACIRKKVPLKLTATSRANASSVTLPKVRDPIDCRICDQYVEVTKLKSKRMHRSLSSSGDSTEQGY
jgi:hypothetical protein